MGRRGRHTYPRRRRGPVLAAGGLALVVGVTTLAVAQVRSGGLLVGPSAAVTAGSSAPLAAVPPAAGVSPAATTNPPAASRSRSEASDRERKVRAAVLAALQGRPGVVDVAVTDVAGRQVVHVGDAEPVQTASVVKLLVLRALQARGNVTQRERVLATRMITRSDNAAASALWRVTGGTGGIARAAKAAGMTHTVRTDPRAVRWAGWRTTAEDQVRLLRSISTGRGDDDRWTRSLMARVIEEQRWGVGSLPGAVGVKNGWLPVDDGWIVNTDGCVVEGSRRLCVSVLSTGSRSLSVGVRTVELAAQAAVRAWT